MNSPVFIPQRKMEEYTPVAFLKICVKYEKYVEKHGVKELPNCQFCKEPYAPNPKVKEQKFCSTYCLQKEWQTANREYNNKRVREYRARRYRREGRWIETGNKATELREWMNEIKSKPCNDCGNCFEICCMDFDHRYGTVKEYNVGAMFAHHYSRELIEIEIEKCDLVCSNCHRIRTRDRRIGSGIHGKRCDEKQDVVKSKAVR